MTRVINPPGGPRIVIIENEPDQKCELCGKMDMCRPYGPNNELICEECGMKDPEMVEIKIREHLFGECITREQARAILMRRKHRDN